MEIKTFPLTEVKAGAADGLAENEFSGYASTFGPPVDSYGDVVEPGAFRDALPEFLEKGFIADQHNWNEPIGKPIEAYEDTHGLFIRARISDTQRGRDILTLLRDKVITQLSIGYKAAVTRILDEAEVVGRWGQTVGDDVMRSLPLGMPGPRSLIKIYPLFETSPVSVAANQNATVLAVKALLANVPEAEVLNALKDMGLLAGLTLQEQFEFTLAVNRAFKQRYDDLVDLRQVKEGRVISGTHRTRMSDWGGTARDMERAMGAMASDIEDLLAATEPTPKETPKDGADVAARVTALRAAHMRLIRLSLTTQE